MTPEQGQIIREPLKAIETGRLEPLSYINPEFEFDWNHYLIRFAAQDRPDVQLKEIGGKVLEVITRRPNVVIPPDSYCELVWDSPHYESSNLKPHITNLRQQLSADPATFNIRAISGSGYILQDHNWKHEAISEPLTEDGAVRYYPDTRDFSANGMLEVLTKTEGQIVQTLAKSMGEVVRTHRLNANEHNDRHARRSTAVQIHRLNRKLSKHGVSIKSVRDEGYMLKVDSRKARH